MSTYTSPNIVMDFSERIEVKARDLGIKWNNIDANVDWNNASLELMKFSIMSEEWSKQAIPSAKQQFEGTLVTSKEMSELFDKWFDAPQGAPIVKHDDLIK